MKRLFIAFVLTFIFHSSYSQLTTGNWLVGGSGSYFSSKSTFNSPSFSQESDGFDLSVSPNVGYFLLDRFAVGLSPTFSWSKFKDNSGANSNIKRFLIGPFARYYFLNTDKPYNILVASAYQYGTYSFKPTKGNIQNFSAAVGSVIFFNSSVGLEFTIGYSSRIEDIRDSYKTTQKGLQVGIGLQIHLQK